MKTRPLSASSIKTYLQCLLKYKFNYVDKKPREMERDHLVFGTAVHEALEEMHKKMMETGQEPDQELYNYVYKVFMDSATANGLQNFALYQDGKDILTRRLDSVSAGEKVLGTELGFELETENGTPFLGNIDKVVEVDENTVAIVDYKTSNTMLTQEEADFDIQLSMYDLAISRLYPQYKTILLVLDYVKLNEEVITHRTVQQRALFVDFIDSIFDGIKKVEVEQLVPRLNQFCGWCDFKQFCPEYVRLVSDPDFILKRPDAMDDEEFIREWDHVQNVARIIEDRSRSLKSEAHHRVSTQHKSVKAGGKELYKVQSSRVDYDVGVLFKVIPPEDLVQLVSANKKAVDRYVQNNPQMSDDVNKATKYSSNSAYFKVKKSQEGK